MKKLATIVILLFIIITPFSKQSNDTIDISLYNKISQMLDSLDIDYKEIQNNIDTLVKQEEERLAEEARKAEEARLAEIARLEALPVNFDEVFHYINVGQCPVDVCQSYIDSDYVTKYFGDYYHHNTQTFLNLFFRLKPGKTVIIGGQTYTCTYVTTGYVSEDMSHIYTDAGEVVADERAGTEIITCKDEVGGRYIAYIE